MVPLAIAMLEGMCCAWQAAAERKVAVAASQERADIEGSVAELVSSLKSRMSTLANQVLGQGSGFPGVGFRNPKPWGTPHLQPY